MGVEIGGKCLAFHGPLLYEAKVLKKWDHVERKVTMIEPLANDASGNNVDEDDEPEAQLQDQECYFIHYQGWKSSWDEWVGWDRIKEFSPENVELKKKLLQDAKDAKKDLKNKKRKYNLETGPVKRGRPSLADQKASMNATTATVSVPATNGHAHIQNSIDIPKIHMHIPAKLKAVLVNDWEYITKDKKVMHLPQEMSVEKILNMYEKQLSNTLESPSLQSQLIEYVEGLKLYFETSLSVHLLYRLERLQFDELKSKSHLIGTYGSIHLLRLLSKLPELMTNTTMDSQSCALIVKDTESLLTWLMVNNDNLKLFPDADSVDDFYVNTSSQYEGVALGM